MTFYIIIAIIVGIFSFFETNSNKISYKIIVFFILIIGVFRAENVGLDIQGYTLNIKNMTSNTSTWNYYTEFEIGYNYFLWFLKQYISEDPMVILSFSFIIYILSVSFFIKKTTRKHSLTFLFFILLGYLTLSFNIMRQTMALGLACLSIYFFLIKEKRILPYVLTIISIAFLFHYTFFSFLLLLLFYLKKLDKKTTISLLILSFILFYFDTLNFILYSIDITIFSEKYQSYLNQEADSEVSIVSNLLHTLFCIYIVTISFEKKDLFLFSYILGILLLNILGGFNPLFIRVATMFQFFQIIYFSNLWFNLPNIKNKNIFRFAVLFYSLIVYLNILIKNYGNIIPYNFKFF